MKISLRCPRSLVAMAAIGLASLASACAPTRFYGSAASPAPGFVYVVGQHDDAARVWLCPTTSVRGECRPVDVQVL